jgi:hypothetical protein
MKFSFSCENDQLLLFLSLSYLQQYNTKYYYKLGTVTVREFFFSTPPAPGLDVPYIFGLIGKLSRLLSLSAGCKALLFTLRARQFCDYWVVLFCIVEGSIFKSFQNFHYLGLIPPSGQGHFTSRWKSL